MKLSDINLGFLWEKRIEIVVDAPDPFDEKWDTEYLKFSEFIKVSPIPKVIELMIIAYKDTYPRTYWSGSFLNNKIFKSNPKRDSDRVIVFDKSYMSRQDIVSYSNKEKIAKGEFEYPAKIMLEFVSNYNLATPIERALNGKNYTKNTIENQTIYVVENSPIAQLEITDKSFKLIVNKEHYQYIV